MGTKKIVWCAEDGTQFDSEHDMLRHEHNVFMRKQVDIFLDAYEGLAKNRRTEYRGILYDWLESADELVLYPAPTTTTDDEHPTEYHDQEGVVTPATAPRVNDEDIGLPQTVGALTSGRLSKADLGDGIGGLTDAEIEEIGRNQ